MTTKYYNVNKKQGGLALLVLVIIIFLAVTTYYFSKISIVEIKANNLQKTRVALKAAKEALIGYAILRSDLSDPSLQPAKYGYLPCPANNNGDGNSVGSCGVAKQSSIGWFPWRSLGMEPLKDSNGDCLLYAVSSTYKYNPEAGMLNEDTNFGMFQVVDENNNLIYGDTAQNRVVAIVFSAGGVLPGQVRNKDPSTECGDDADNFDAYLDAFEVSPGDIVDNSDVDSINIDIVDRFVQATTAVNQDVFNDQLLVISREEIWPKAIAHRDSAFDIADTTGASKVRRLTEALARCLASYANDNDNSSLPRPAPLALSGNDYRDNVNYTDANTTYIGRFPYMTDQADGVIPGRVLGVLFEKNFNGPIDPPPPQLPPPPPPALPIPPVLPTGIWSCDMLLINSPMGPYADLMTSASEDRRLWDNWKDRIIYAVSQRYAARAIPSVDSLESMSPPVTSQRCNEASVSDNACITYSGTAYAAIVIYSGSIMGGQTRDAPIAAIDAGVVIDTKQDLNNYIEVNNPAGNGQGDYTPESWSNDLYFCLTDTEPVDVIECS